MSQKTQWRALLWAALGIGALTLAGCAGTSGGSGNGGYNYGGTSATATTANTTTAPQTAINLNCPSGATVCTKQVSVSGQTKTVLANTSGMTLYYFQLDTSTSSACTGSCAQTWPALTASSSANGAGLSGTLTTISDANGQQVTYNGHPLYIYSGDRAQSDANGDGIDGQWHVATPDLAASTSSSGTGAPGGGGGFGGY